MESNCKECAHTHALYNKHHTFTSGNRVAAGCGTSLFQAAVVDALNSPLAEPAPFLHRKLRINLRTHLSSQSARPASAVDVAPRTVILRKIHFSSQATRRAQTHRLFLPCARRVWLICARRSTGKLFLNCFCIEIKTARRIIEVLSWWNACELLHFSSGQVLNEAYGSWVGRRNPQGSNFALIFSNLHFICWLQNVET